MRRTTVLVSALALAAGLMAGGVPGAAAVEPGGVSMATGQDEVLVFTRTAGFRHDSIEAGAAAVAELARQAGLSPTVTQDPAAFSDARLADVAAVVFLNTTGDVLDGPQQSALERYVTSGGGFLGIHAAADTEYGWPFYAELVGARFAGHPAVQAGIVTAEGGAHPAVAHLTSPWQRVDEWYAFDRNPRGTSRVLATLDERSYTGGTMGADHPIAWCRVVGGGRSVYTAGGHTAESFGDGAFRQHLLGALQVSAGLRAADCRPELGYSAVGAGLPAAWRLSDPARVRADGWGHLLQGPVTATFERERFSSVSVRADWQARGGVPASLVVGRPAGLAPGVPGGTSVTLGGTSTGTVVGFGGPDAAAVRAALDPQGWNSTEVLVQGRRVQVFLNGVQVNDVTVPSSGPSTTGHLALVTASGGDLAVRTLRVRDLTVPAQVVEAEDAVATVGVSPFAKPSARFGRTLGYVDGGDSASFAGIATDGRTSLRARVVSGGPGGQVQVRAGSPSGPLVGVLRVPHTGGWDTYATVETRLTGLPASSSSALSLVFTGAGGGLFDVDRLEVVRGGAGVVPGAVRGLGGLCLDVSGASTADGARMQTWTCNGTGAQRWTLDGGTVRALGKCLDVSGGSTADGARVQLWTCNGTGAQEWAPGDGGVLVNGRSGKCLDVAGYGRTDGSVVHLWSCHGDVNQRWSPSTS